MGPSEMDPSEIWHNWGGGGGKYLFEMGLSKKWGDII